MTAMEHLQACREKVLHEYSPYQEFVLKGIEVLYPGLSQHENYVKSDEIPPRKQTVWTKPSNNTGVKNTGVKPSIELSDYAGEWNVVRTGNTALGHKPKGPVVSAQETHTDAALEALDCND